jgi:hypothetical protein
MSDVVYSLSAINSRLSAVVATIDAGSGNGALVLIAGSTAISTIALAKPSAVISSGVLTFSGTLQDPLIAKSGIATGARIQDSNANVIVSGLIVSSNSAIGADIVLSTASLIAGESSLLTSATITGD